MLLALLCLLGGVQAIAQEDQRPSPEELLEEQLALQRQSGIWIQPGGNFAAARYSETTEITNENAAQLEVQWTMSTGVLRGHEGQPLIVNDMMYFTTPFPNILYAIDLNNPGEIAWQFTPQVDERGVGSACCDVVNLGASYSDGMLFYNSLDGQVWAVDAEDGSLIWRATNADPYRGETMTNAPLVAKDKVIVGVSGGELGVRGYVTAYDAYTGERLWRYYNTGPDDEVGIGDRYESYYDHLNGEDLGVNTWPGDQWQVGGSTVWGWFSYDPDLNLFYYGTSNPGTWNPSLRRGDPDELDDQTRWANLFSAALMARDLDTGELVWAYQFTPHDEWDYDGVNENLLIDLEWEGETRKVIMRFERNGFAYVIDRETGEVLSAEQFGEGINWAHGIDIESGLPIRNPEKSNAQGKLVEDICPASLGAKNRQPSAFSPQTGYFYVPMNNICMDYQATDVAYIPGVPYVGATVRMFPGPGGHRGFVLAWDAINQEPAWRVEENFSVWSGTLATAGDVVFYGTLDGFFKALDAVTGEELWSFQTGSGIVGGPITCLGPDGRQYVAILSGVGGWAGLVVAADMAVDDETAALGAIGAYADLPRYTKKGGALFVFALPEGDEGAQDAAGDGGEEPPEPGETVEPAGVDGVPGSGEFTPPPGTPAGDGGE